MNNKNKKQLPLFLAAITSLGLFSCDNDTSSNDETTQSHSLALSYSENGDDEAEEVANELTAAITNYWNSEIKMARFYDLDFELTFSYVYGGLGSNKNASITREFMNIQVDSLEFELRTKQGESYINEEGEEVADVELASGEFEDGNIIISFLSDNAIDSKEIKGNFYYEDKMLYCDASSSDAQGLFSYISYLLLLENYEDGKYDNLDSISIPDDGKVYLDEEYLSLPYSLPIMDEEYSQDIYDFFLDILEAAPSCWEISPVNSDLSKLNFGLTKDDILSFLSRRKGEEIAEEASDYFSINSFAFSFYYGDSLSAITLDIDIGDIDPNLWVLLDLADSDSSFLPSGSLILKTSLSLSNDETAFPLTIDEEEKAAYTYFEDCLVYTEEE